MEDYSFEQSTNTRGQTNSCIKSTSPSSQVTSDVDSLQTKRHQLPASCPSSLPDDSIVAHSTVSKVLASIQERDSLDSSIESDLIVTLDEVKEPEVLLSPTEWPSADKSNMSLSLECIQRPSTSTNKMSRRRKECKSIKIKHRVVCAVEEAEKKSKKEVTRVRKEMIEEYKLTSNAIITNWMKKKESIKEAYLRMDPSTKTIKDGKFPELEKALVKWIIIQEQMKMPLTYDFIRLQARQIAENLGIQNSEFNASSGWYYGFCSRNNIGRLTAHGDEGTVTPKTVDDWERKVNEITKNYQPGDIYNADETGLFFRLLPSKTYSVKGKKMSRGKQSKNRLTVLFCTNMDGSDKKEIVVVGKSAKPRCFKNKNPPVQYFHNQNSWMTTDIFEKVLVKWDKEFEKEDRHVLLFLDNFSGHPTKLQSRLERISLVFLPPNTTSRLQPLDQGIIRSAKCHYRKLLLGHLLTVVNSSGQCKADDVKINVLQAMTWLKVAWMRVTRTTISNCFKHAKFSTTEEEPEEVLELDNLPQLLSDLDNENVLPDDYVDVDDKLITFETQTDDNDNDDDDKDEDDKEEQEHEVPLPSFNEVFDALLVLSNFNFHSQVVDHGQLYDIQRKIQSFRVDGLKQSKITDHFRPVSES